MTHRPRFDPHEILIVGESAEREDLNRVLWIALVAALTTFLRAVRLRLEIKDGEHCPKCGHAF